jgi:hypothetical protein
MAQVLIDPNPDSIRYVSFSISLKTIVTRDRYSRNEKKETQMPIRVPKKFAWPKTLRLYIPVLQVLATVVLLLPIYDQMPTITFPQHLSQQIALAAVVLTFAISVVDWWTDARKADRADEERQALERRLEGLEARVTAVEPPRPEAPAVLDSNQPILIDVAATPVLPPLLDKPKPVNTDAAVPQPIHATEEDATKA